MVEEEEDDVDQLAPPREEDDDDAGMTGFDEAPSEHEPEEPEMPQVRWSCKKIIKSVDNGSASQTSKRGYCPRQNLQFCRGL